MMSISGPAILNETLQIPDLITQLNKLAIRIKVSKSTLPGTCIFPKVSLAVMLMTLSHDRLDNLAEVENRVRTFIDMHGQPFVVVLVDKLERDVMNFVGDLQLRLLPKDVNIAFVLNYAEAISVMMNLITFNQPNVREVFGQQMKENLPYGNEEQILINILKFVGLEVSDCYLALDNFGSIGAIAKASKEDLADSGLSQCAVSTIVDFFEEDTVEEGNASGQIRCVRMRNYSAAQLSWAEILKAGEFARLVSLAMMILPVYIVLGICLWATTGIHATIEIKGCEGDLPKPDGIVKAIRITNCDSSPCSLEKKKTYKVEFDIMPPKDAKNVDVSAFAAFGKVEMPWIGLKTDACKEKFIKNCPVKTNELITYINDITIQNVYPLISVPVRWKVKFDDSLITCFTIGAKIVAASGS